MTTDAKLEIVQAVVRSIAVLVMNCLTWKKETAKRLLHDEAMLEDVETPCADGVGVAGRVGEDVAVRMSEARLALAARPVPPARAGLGAGDGSPVLALLEVTRALRAGDGRGVPLFHTGIIA